MKWIFGLFLALVVSGLVFAANQYLLVSRASVVGAGNSIELSQPAKTHTLITEYVDANGGISALSIEFQATAAGHYTADADAKWVTLRTYSLSATERSERVALFNVTTTPLLRVRARVATATSIGTGDYVDVYYIPSEN